MRTSDGPRPSMPAAARPSPEAGLSKADAVAAVLWVGVTFYAVFGGADFGAGLWALLAGERRARQAAPRADRLGDRPRLGGEPRLADLRAGGALDGVPGRVRVDHVDAVHPAQPGRARDRAARRRALPSTRSRPGWAGRRVASACFARLVGAHAFLHGHGRRRDRVRAGAGRQRRRATRSRAG